MSEFFDVVNEFDDLTGKYDFKLPRKLWYSHLVALSRHIDDVFYCYVIARVHKNDGSLETTLWVGPVQRPDDGLDNLSANIKMPIGYNQTLDENFFRDCEKKIVNLIENGTLQTLLATSKKELAEPSVANRRYEVYTQYLLPFFKAVVKEVGGDKKTLNNKKKCEEVIEKVLAGLDGVQKEFFDKLGSKATVDKVWELCYIYSL
jgi:hypothetical protein